MFDKSDYELRQTLASIQGQFKSMQLLATLAMDCLSRIERLQDGSFACQDAHVTLGEMDKVLKTQNAVPRS
jgi:hypothetical protein